jgi:hypothetical protein
MSCRIKYAPFRASRAARTTKAPRPHGSIPSDTMLPADQYTLPGLQTRSKFEIPEEQKIFCTQKDCAWAQLRVPFTQTGFSRHVRNHGRQRQNCTFDGCSAKVMNLTNHIRRQHSIFKCSDLACNYRDNGRSISKHEWEEHGKGGYSFSQRDESISHGSDTDEGVNTDDSIEHTESLGSWDVGPTPRAFLFPSLESLALATGLHPPSRESIFTTATKFLTGLRPGDPEAWVCPTQERIFHRNVESLYRLHESSLESLLIILGYYWQDPLCLATAPVPCPGPVIWSFDSFKSDGCPHRHHVSIGTADLYRNDRETGGGWVRALFLKPRCYTCSNDLKLCDLLKEHHLFTTNQGVTCLVNACTRPRIHPNCKSCESHFLVDLRKSQFRHRQASAEVQDSLLKTISHLQINLNYLRGSASWRKLQLQIASSRDNDVLARSSISSGNGHQDLSS